MAVALTEAAARRAGLYRGLLRRNRAIGALRFLVPGLGVAVFALLAGQVLIANLAENFSIGRITLQSDRMVVETPAYSGVTADGSVYRVTALSAEAGLAAVDAVTLNGATLVIEGRDGDQTVDVDGRTTVESSSGMSGTVVGLGVDFTAQSATATGQVDFTFAGGERLEASDMAYDGATRTWTFGGVTLTLPAGPGTMTR
jgi:hypothetical protein